MLRLSNRVRTAWADYPSVRVFRCITTLARNAHLLSLLKQSRHHTLYPSASQMSHSSTSKTPYILQCSIHTIIALHPSLLHRHHFMPVNMIVQKSQLRLSSIHQRIIHLVLDRERDHLIYIREEVMNTKEGVSLPMFRKDLICLLEV